MQAKKTETSESTETSVVEWASATKGGNFGLVPEVGDVIEGYLLGFEVTKGKFGENKNPILQKKDGSKVTLSQNGNLKYLLPNIEQQGGGIGSYIRIERRADYMNKKTGKMQKFYDQKVAKNVDKIDVNTRSDF